MNKLEYYHNRWNVPLECPSCGASLIRDGQFLRCINKECASQVVNRLVDFIKRLGVKSASNATLLKFGITSFDKLISFSPDKKYKSEMKLADELHSKMFSQSKEKLLCAMNFKGLSNIMIDKIVSHYGMESIESENFKQEAFKSFPAGVGETTLNSFIDGLPDALRNLSKITNDVHWHYVGNVSSISRVESRGSICVTGSLKFGSREKFLEFARSKGFEPKSGVSRGLTYLVNNDIDSMSSKNKKAKTLGIPIVSEDEFMKIVNDAELEASLDDL